MSTSEAERIKAWLSRYWQQSKELNHLYDELETFEDQATAAGISRLDGMPKQAGYNDRMSSMVSRLDEMRENISLRQAEATATRREIENAISQINSARWADKRGVLRFRYLILLPWSDVTNAVFGAKTDYLEKEDSYIRRVMRLHAEALKDLGEIISTEEATE